MPVDPPERAAHALPMGGRWMSGVVGLLLTTCASAQPVPIGVTVANGRVVIVHRDAMGNTYRLRSMTDTFDDSVVFSADDQQALRGPVIPAADFVAGEGSHALVASVIYGGVGYGVFSYVAGYTFRVRGTHTVDVERGSTVCVCIVAFERGDVTTSLEERPALRFITRDHCDVRVAADVCGEPVATSPGG